VNTLSTLLIIHGAPGSGKTTTAEKLVQRAQAEGHDVGGILSLRVMRNGETIGYDAYNIRDGRRFPLVLSKKLVENDDWEEFGGLMYAFSKTGFHRVNEMLKAEADHMNPKTIVVADEFGHLELKKKGIYPSLISLRDSINLGGVLAILCRTDKVDAVTRMFDGRKARILLTEAGQTDIYESLIKSEL